MDLLLFWWEQTWLLHSLTFFDLNKNDNFHFNFTCLVWFHVHMLLNSCKTVFYNHFSVPNNIRTNVENVLWHCFVVSINRTNTQMTFDTMSKLCSLLIAQPIQFGRNMSKANSALNLISQKYAEVCSSSPHLHKNCCEKFPSKRRTCIFFSRSIDYSKMLICFNTVKK